MHYKNNWISLHPKVEINFPSIGTQTFYNELLNNAALIRDSFNGPLDLFFSGGINAQAVLRTYIDLKIPIRVFIVKYENDYNLDDVDSAIKTCIDLGVNYKIIDFKLQHFFENDAGDLLTKTDTIDIKKLPLLKSLEYTDGIPIIGNRDPYIYRSSYYYDQPSEWLLKMTNEDFVFQKYNLGRPIIGDWFFYSPEVFLSYLKENQIKKLVSDQVYQRLSSVSSRGNIYKNIWPDFSLREKKSGFEKPNSVFLYPDFMLDFFEKNMNDFEVKETFVYQISFFSIVKVMPAELQ